MHFINLPVNRIGVIILLSCYISVTKIKQYTILPWNLRRVKADVGKGNSISIITMHQLLESSLILASLELLCITKPSMTQPMNHTNEQRDEEEDIVGDGGEGGRKLYSLYEICG